MTSPAARVAAVALAVALGAGCTPDRTGPAAAASVSAGTMPAAAAGPFPVADVVDGDTVTVRRGGAAVTVRLLGIDTPETVDPDEPVQCFGPQAAARAAELLTGQQVWLEPDPSQDPADRYGRELAYVWLTGDELLNLTLIAEGYAREYTFDRRYRLQATFRGAQAAAKQASVGLWAPAACADTEARAGAAGLSTDNPAATRPSGAAEGTNGTGGARHRRTPERTHTL